MHAIRLVSAPSLFRPALAAFRISNRSVPRNWFRSGFARAGTRSLANQSKGPLIRQTGPNEVKATKTHTEPAAASPVAKQVQRKENIWTLPNVLTMTRLAAAPCIGYLIVQHNYPAALGLTVYASVTDFVDGWLARRYSDQTVFGSIADPAADKALMVTLAACLTWSGAVPVWCGLTILGRDVALAVSAIFVRWRTLPAPKTLSRYFDVTLPSVQVTPTQISKWNTFFQMVYLSLCLANPVVPLLSDETGTALALLVSGTTVWSGLSYVFSKTAVRRL